MKKHFRCLVISLTVIYLSTAASFSQGTAFTYQGRLLDAGNPANGSYDFTFALFTANAGGSPFAGPTNATTAVSNGLFTVLLDFGSGVFTGTNLWLEIGVRTNGASGFTLLSQRQPITPAPYAIFSAQAATVPDGAIGAAQIAPGAIGSDHLASGSLAFVPHNIQVFTSSGTWIRPTNVFAVYVKVIGRGGNGDNSIDSRPRGGSGAGGYAEGFIAVTGDVAVTIGETNSFSGLTTIQATAGADALHYTGGAGDMGSGGAVNLRGSAGQSISETVNGTGGMGGSSAMGAGGTGAALTGGSVYIEAKNGENFGGGGGGATHVGRQGGIGNQGAVIVYY